MALHRIYIIITCGLSIFTLGMYFSVSINENILGVSFMCAGSLIILGKINQVFRIRRGYYADNELEIVDFWAWVASGRSRDNGGDGSGDALEEEKRGARKPIGLIGVGEV